MTAGNGRFFQWRNDSNLKAAAYTRDMDATVGQPHEQKFDGFLRLCDEAANGDFQIVVVAFPDILGDDYDELIRNLARAAEAGLLVAIAKPS